MLYHPPALACPEHSTTRRRRGATMMEYLFMLSLIIVVAISAIGSLGSVVRKSTEDSATKITTATKGK